MSTEHEDDEDLRSLVEPVLHSIEDQVATLRALLGVYEDDGEVGDEELGAEELGAEEPEPGGEAADGADGGPPGDVHESLGALTRDVLTQREQEVLTVLSKGVPNVVIARTLGISVPTVKVHLQSIFRKLAVSGRAEAIVQVLSRQEPSTRPPR